MKEIRTSKFCILSLIIIFTFLIASPAPSVVKPNEVHVNFPVEVNGRIIIMNINDSKVSVLLQINTSSGLDALGGATMVVGFDTSTISINANPIKNTDYVFHNFCGENYSPATITRPMGNRIWINIDLPFQNCNEGTFLAGGDNWTDVVTIIFDILNPDGLINIYWLYDSPFWGIYDDDNTTIWNVGVFEDALNIPLPVELSSFAALLIENKVKLCWTTETEVNNYGFEVERKVIDGGWASLGFVAGNGNSNSPKKYIFFDVSIYGGSVLYYRLKQIDTDGNFKYSETVEVELAPSSFSLSQNYPNPFNISTSFQYSVPEISNVTLKVFDVSGNEVSVLVNEEKKKGMYLINFDASRLASGIYFYRLQASGFFEAKKMILLR